MTDTIVAIATPPGFGGIGVVRASGGLSLQISRELTGLELQPRRATLANFQDSDGSVIDVGLALWFPGPASFTGEDVVELQGHGGPVVLQMLVDRACQLGARPALPGEFTERAYLNDRMDLAQAEAVADLIACCSREGARAVLRSLKGEFSEAIHAIERAIQSLRVHIEACLDFPEEEIDFLQDAELKAASARVASDLDDLLERSRAGSKLVSGLRLVIAGASNVGKSSLLNRLVGEDRAIVTPIEGTTRDVVEGNFLVDGLPINVLDTAGLRESPDPVEALGMDRARREMETADAVLWVSDDRLSSEPRGIDPPMIHARNKADLSGRPPGRLPDGSVRISALTGAGIASLRLALKNLSGYTGGGVFAGRPRHLAELAAARKELEQGILALGQGSGDLAAESIRRAQQHLGAIVGFTTSDELLGEIFSSFCIGK